MKINQYLREKKLLADGSFGTYYGARYQTDEMPELANTNHRERVEEIHLSYIESGARFIRTNTFACNTALLSSDINILTENIKSAISCAKSAVLKSKKEVYIAGDIGHIPENGTIDYEQLEEQYYIIGKTFAENGIDILLFETLPDAERIMPAIKRLKSEYDLFVILQFCVNQYGYSSSGQSAARLLADADKSELVDATGLNCGVGPGHMDKILSKASVSDKTFLTALPNSGYPQVIRSRIQYSDNAEYFSQKVSEIADKGADIVGGCCGTSPRFIKSLSELLDTTHKPRVYQYHNSDTENKSNIKNGFFRNTDGTLKDKKLIAVELAPPADACDDRLLEAARYLKSVGVDVLTFPDSPSGRTRTDSVLMAQKVRLETGLEVMPHICCRDKNAIAMRSLFLGAKINDIKNFLIITGDPIPAMARQTTKSVFNFDSVGLMKILRDMNTEMFSDSPIAFGGAINQSRLRIDGEVKRVLRKIEAGAEFFLSQPVFSKEDADRLRLIKEQTGARILCGIMPLVSRKNALFMKHEIAGVPVTDEIVERYPENATKEQGEAVGIEIAKEVIDLTSDFADGYYFTFPFNRVHMLDKIL